ncbi:MAG: hypothetical protein M3217_11390 [Actinomycetota bacterium]|nr:hypothetical protein [Actinomycetota bacterium]
MLGIWLAIIAFVAAQAEELLDTALEGLMMSLMFVGAVPVQCWCGVAGHAALGRAAKTHAARGPARRDSLGALCRGPA